MTSCNHADFERCLYDTWCLVEVNAAIRYGYTVMETTDIWEYNTEQYSVETKSGGDFMKRFLKLKQGSNGYPDHVISDTDKEKYLQQFSNENDIGTSGCGENFCEHIVSNAQ